MHESSSLVLRYVAFTISSIVMTSNGVCLLITITIIIYTVHIICIIFLHFHRMAGSFYFYFPFLTLLVKQDANERGKKNLKINYNLFSSFCIFMCALLPPAHHPPDTHTHIWLVFVLYKSLTNKANQIPHHPPSFSLDSPLFLSIGLPLPPLVSVANERHMGWV